MAAPNKIKKLVTTVLKEQAVRYGRTTVEDTTTLVYMKVERRGGYTRFGIGSAEIAMAVKSIIRGEVQVQLKTKMPDGVQLIAMKNAPVDLVQYLPALPRWIATAEGPGAQWVPSLIATKNEWRLNANMKFKKSAQTEAQAQVSADIVRLMDLYNIETLGTVVTAREDEESVENSKKK